MRRIILEVGQVKENGKAPADSLYWIVQPPSIMSVSPVIRDAAGEARNTTGSATSSGVPIRPSGMRFCTDLRNSLLPSHFLVPGVSIKVGATALTVMLYFAHSSARHLVRCAIAAFVMQ